MPKPTALVVALLLSTLVHAPIGAQRPDSALVGEWSGVAQVAEDWVVQRALPVRVAIRADGSVSGTVGDAALSGSIRSNRSVIARAVGLGTDWVVEGALTGPLISREAIQRDRVRLPLDWTGTTLSGTLETSGSYERRRADTRLTAKGLVLRRGGGPGGGAH